MLLRSLLLIFGALLLRPAAALDVEVDIHGLSESALEDNVEAYLSVLQEQKREGLTESRLRLLHKQADEEIRQALRPFGYFRPKISAKLEKVGDGYRADYRIEAGPAVRLAEVDVRLIGEGEDDPGLRMAFPLAEGDPLDQTAYENGKTALQSLAVEQGYLKAKYEVRELKVDLDAYTAGIRLHLDTGPHYRFGEIRFFQDQLDEAFLRRYLDFGQGDPFSHARLLALQSKLINSEYFSKVEVRILRNQAKDRQVPIEVRLSPNKRNRYRAGFGLSTDTGPRITLDWKRRFIGRQGHNMLTELRLSAPRSKLSTEYIIPLQRPDQDSLSFGGSFDFYDTDSRSGISALLNASHSIDLGEGWRRTLGLSYSYEDYTVGDQDDNAFLLVPSVKWDYLNSDGRDFILRGQRLELRLEGAWEPLLSSTSYLQAYARDKFIRGFGDGQWRVLARGELGATLAGEVTDLPGSKRFFAGGDNSVRGFGLDEIGPQDDLGEVVGGRFLAVGSLELERRIQGKWSGAVFFDVGNAFDPDLDNRLEYGAGVGVRWLSPVGPIRVDAAAGLSADETQFQLHIVVGPEL